MFHGFRSAAGAEKERVRQPDVPLLSHAFFFLSRLLFQSAHLVDLSP